MEYNENILHWLASVAMGMMIIILVVTNTVFVYKICVTKHTTKSAVLSGLAAIISFTLTAILLFAACVISLITNDNTTTSKAAAISFIALVMYAISQTIMVSTFTIRIDKTFQGTGLASSKCVLRGLYIASAILIMFGFSIVLSIIFGSWVILILGGIVWIFVYFVTTVTLVVLFIRKIEELVIIRYKFERENSVRSVVDIPSDTVSKTDGNKHVPENNKVTKAMVNSKLFVLAVKHGLLVPIAITSSVICFVLDILVFSIMGNDQFHAAAAFWFVLDATISCWCIFLLFAFNHGIYNRLCYPMHQSCEKCEIWKLKRSNKLKTEMEMTANQN